MAQKSLTIETTPREKEIFATATAWRVKVGVSQPVSFDNESVARAEAERLSVAAGNRGAMLYAVGTSCACESSALLATFNPRTGWKESDR